MSHPYIIVNGASWNKMLSHLQDTVIGIASLSINEVEKIEEISKQYAEIISENKDHIFRATAQNILEYINFHRVFPQEGAYDEFKGIYFIGESVTDCLIRFGLLDLNKIHQRAVLRLLDFRLAEPYGAYREILSERIKKTIDHNKVSDHFGKYGWYITYKCLYNAANENSKTV